MISSRITPSNIKNRDHMNNPDILIKGYNGYTFKCNLFN